LAPYAIGKEPQNPPSNLGIKTEISRLWSTPDHHQRAFDTPSGIAFKILDKGWSWTYSNDDLIAFMPSVGKEVRRNRYMQSGMYLKGKEEKRWGKKELAS
jgi:hypothetical protein